MIPKIIHQIWLGKDNPMPIVEMETWKKNHPTWEYKLWTDENLPQLELKELYDSWGNRWHGKADILRYEILYKYGGVYIDADAKSLRPMDDIVLDQECWAIYENEVTRPGLLANGFLGAVPGNPFFRLLIDGLKGKLASPADKPWLVCGTQYITDKAKESGYPITKFPSYYFLPYHFSGQEYKGDFKPYANHFWGTTKSLYNKAATADQVSIVIPHFEITPDRTTNLLSILKWYRKELPETEIIVVEQDKEPRTKRAVEGLATKYVFVEHSGLFNKSLAVNRGIQASNRPIIAMVDNDVLLGRGQFLKGLKQMKAFGGTYDIFQPWDSCLQASESQTTMFHRFGQLNENALMFRGHSNHQHGGIVLMDRERLLDIGGMNEEFQGWGGEDDEILARAKKNGYVVGWATDGTRLIHLFHNRPIECTDKQPHYSQNVQLLRKAEEEPPMAFKNLVQRLLNKCD